MVPMTVEQLAAKRQKLNKFKAQGEFSRHLAGIGGLIGLAGCVVSWFKDLSWAWALAWAGGSCGLIVFAVTYLTWLSVRDGLDIKSINAELALAEDASDFQCAQLESFRENSLVNQYVDQVIALGRKLTKEELDWLMAIVQKDDVLIQAKCKSLWVGLGVEAS